MSDLKSRVESQRVRVSMNQKHLCVRSADQQLIQMENGQWRELPITDITFHRLGEHNEEPWTRYYNLADPKDAEAIRELRKVLEQNPNLHDDVNFRIRIVGEFDGHGEPWPGYDDQDAEQIIAYYHAMPAKLKPSLEQLMQYELAKGEDQDTAKVVAIETLDKTQESTAKKQASAGVKL